MQRSNIELMKRQSSLQCKQAAAIQELVKLRTTLVKPTKKPLPREM